MRDLPGGRARFGVYHYGQGEGGNRCRAALPLAGGIVRLKLDI
ncbi:MAG: hypothetical protein ACPH5G_16760 [Pseudooceanicola atlanticus]